MSSANKLSLNLKDKGSFIHEYWIDSIYDHLDDVQLKCMPLETRSDVRGALKISWFTRCVLTQLPESGDANTDC